MWPRIMRQVTRESCGPTPGPGGQPIAAGCAAALYNRRHAYIPQPRTRPPRRLRAATLYPEIEPYRSGWLRVSADARDLLGGMRQSARQAGRLRARRSRRRRRCAVAPLLRPAQVSHRRVRPARLRPQPAAREPRSTTRRWHLVADMETLREHLGIDRWLVFGGSWGSTLSLAYAQTHPKRVTELVLRGIFMLREWEIHWFYQHGASAIFPDRWETYIGAIPKAERDDLVGAFYKRLTSRNRATQLKAAKAWSVWEGCDELPAHQRSQHRELGSGRLRDRGGAHRVPLLREPGILRARRPAAAQRAPDPQDSGRDRAGTLRRGLPDAQRLGPAQGLARSGLPHRCRTPGTRRSSPATRTSSCRRRIVSRNSTPVEPCASRWSTSATNSSNPIDAVAIRVDLIEPDARFSSRHALVRGRTESPSCATNSSKSSTPSPLVSLKVNVSRSSASCSRLSSLIGAAPTQSLDGPGTLGETDARFNSRTPRIAVAYALTAARRRHIRALRADGAAARASRGRAPSRRAGPPPRGPSRAPACRRNSCCASVRAAAVSSTSLPARSTEYSIA